MAMDLDALLALRDMLDEGTLDEAGYDAAAARLGDAAEELGPAPEEEDGDSSPADLTAEKSLSEDALHDGWQPEGKAMTERDAMPEGAGSEGAEALPAVPVQPHGYKALSHLHRGMSRLNKEMKPMVDALDDSDVKTHLSSHLDGMSKASKAIKAYCRKGYKGLDELPDDYPDDDAGESVMSTKELAAIDTDDADAPVGDQSDGMMQNAIEGGYEDEAAGGGAMLGQRPEDEDEMTDEDADLLAKSLPALERKYGLR